jgi:hypothetical protein
MKRTLVLVCGLSSVFGVLAVAPACSVVNPMKTWFMKGDVLTYEEYLSVDQAQKPTPTADMVMKKLGTPMEVRDRDGAIREIDYHAYSLNDDLKIATFFFDANQKLAKKDLW